MRLKLSLRCAPNSRLAFDHHYALRAVIYRTIERADSTYSYWLHENGFQLTGKKNFKFFSYGLLQGQPYRRDIARKQLVFPTGQVEWTVGFYIESPMAKFIEGLFKNQSFDVAAFGSKVTFEVEQVEILEKPIFEETMRFSLQTGICLSEKGATDRYEQFRSPEHADYKLLFYNSLAARVQSSTQMPSPQYSDAFFDLKIISEPKKWSTLVPQDNGAPPIRTIGYKYDFEMSAPKEWQEVCYFAGLGKDTSGGFSWMEILK